MVTSWNPSAMICVYVTLPWSQMWVSFIEMDRKPALVSSTGSSYSGNINWWVDFCIKLIYILHNNVISKSLSCPWPWHFCRRTCSICRRSGTPQTCWKRQTEWMNWRWLGAVHPVSWPQGVSHSEWPSVPSSYFQEQYGGGDVRVEVTSSMHLFPCDLDISLFSSIYRSCYYSSPGRDVRTLPTWQWLSRAGRSGSDRSLRKWGRI